MPQPIDPETGMLADTRGLETSTQQTIAETSESIAPKDAPVGSHQVEIMDSGKPVYLEIVGRKYQCHPKIPALPFAKMQKNFIALSQIAKQAQAGGKQELTEEVGNSFLELVELAEILVVAEDWPELEKRLTYPDAPYGAVGFNEVLESVVQLIPKLTGESAPKA